MCGYFCVSVSVYVRFSVSAWASGCVLVFVCTVVYVDVGDSVCGCERDELGEGTEMILQEQ